MPSDFTVKNFFGRDRELEVLRNIHREAKSGDASGIFLSGRNGTGKTELLRKAYYHLFHEQTDAIPFFYTMKTALTSIENFSKDYFCSFIAQSLAFLRKDIALADTCIYSLEDIMLAARESGVKWITDITDRHMQSRNGNDPLNLFMSTISAPYHGYVLGGMPAVVMIDDFHKMRKFCEFNAVAGNKDFWMLFEALAKSRHTPHIFTGYQAELNRMFFEDTMFGEYLELFTLPSLGNEDSVKFFKMLCDIYGIEIRLQLSGLIDLFGGTPYYIKNFVQAVRQSSGILSEDNFWFVYLSEITKGKTFKYWTSILKNYIPHFDLRKPSLGFLYRLSRGDYDSAGSGIPEEFLIGTDDLQHIIGLLHTSGAVETGFSEIEPADDRILTDIIRGLYLREIGKEQWASIKEKMIGDRRQHAAAVMAERTPSFTLTIPATTRAELVAVRTVEYIARNFSVSEGMTGQLQLALADLFANVIGTAPEDRGNYRLVFKMKENIFCAEITVPVPEIVLSEDDQKRLRSYLDSVQVEVVPEGTRITILKDISRDAVSA